MARPKKSILKSEVVRVRFTPGEKRILIMQAEKFGITISEMIRANALNIKLKARLSEEEVGILRALIGMSNNLNQITRRMHSDQAYEADLRILISGVDKLINRLK